jgi:supervillin
MTVELDEERGAQIRVDQGREDAAFLSLWSGKMAVHMGSRQQLHQQQQQRHRLFVVRGETKEEACAVEVQCEGASLRSLASLLLACLTTGVVFLWHGASVPSHAREVAKTYADRLVEDPPTEMNFRGLTEPINLREEFEGCESRDFLQVLRPTASAYLASFPPPLKSPRLFRMSSVSGRFHVDEILCPFRRVDVLNSLPFNQSDLYSAEQPGN